MFFKTGLFCYLISGSYGVKQDTVHTPQAHQESSHRQWSKFWEKNRINHLSYEDLCGFWDKDLRAKMISEGFNEDKILKKNYISMEKWYKLIHGKKDHGFCPSPIKTLLSSTSEDSSAGNNNQSCISAKDWYELMHGKKDHDFCPSPIFNPINASGDFLAGNNKQKDTFFNQYFYYCIAAAGITTTVIAAATTTYIYRKEPNQMDTKIILPILLLSSFLYATTANGTEGRFNCCFPFWSKNTDSDVINFQGPLLTEQENQGNELTTTTGSPLHGLQTKQEDQRNDNGAVIETTDSVAVIDTDTASEHDSEQLRTENLSNGDITQETIDSVLSGDFICIDTLPINIKYNLNLVRQLMSVNAFDGDLSIGVNFEDGRPNLFLLKKAAGIITGASSALFSLGLDNGKISIVDKSEQHDECSAQESFKFLECLSSLYTKNLFADSPSEDGDAGSKGGSVTRTSVVSTSAVSQNETGLILYNEDTYGPVLSFLIDQLKESSEEKIVQGIKKFQSYNEFLTSYVFNRTNAEDVENKIVEIIKDETARNLLLERTAEILEDPISSTLFFAILAPNTLQDEAFNLLLGVHGFAIDFSKPQQKIKYVCNNSKKDLATSLNNAELLVRLRLRINDTNYIISPKIVNSVFGSFKVKKH